MLEIDRLDYKTWVEIDSKAFKKNLQILQKYIGNCKLLTMVKGNAYGHGFIEISKLCEESKVDFVGVETIDEAISLRKNGIKSPILVVIYTPKHRLKALLEYDISQVVYDTEILDAMAGVVAKSSSKFKIHIKFDTGMSRQGIATEEMDRYINILLKYHDFIEIEGLLTHFANADNLNDTTYSEKQLIKFSEIIANFKDRKISPKYIHAFNTAAALSYTDNNPVIPEINMCRVGIGMHGLLPSKDFKVIFENLSLQPVLTWKTRIVQIKEIKKGAFIGYGITEKAEQDSKIAILPVGYYDGISRLYSSIGHVLIGGKRCKILGRISMNLTVVDISQVTEEVKVWDEVIIIGKQNKETITADEFADKTNTINYEVVTRVNPLIKRIVI